MHLSHPFKSQRVLIRASIVSVLIVLFWCFFTTVYFFEGIYDTDKNTLRYHPSESLSCNSNPLCYVPQQKISVWKEREFLIVFGIPSLDIPIRRWRRRMQRVTCWQFPEVATRQNNFSGAMLLLYLLAPHPMNNNTLSKELVEEAEQWQDIVIHPRNEATPTTNKIKDDKGYWGIEAEIGSSRKTFFWFQFALRQFPRVPYVAKCDDDTFISVPQYLYDLRRLPQKKIYWGYEIVLNVTINKKGNKQKIRYMVGYCYTIARDAVEALVSYKPIRRLISLEYSKQTEADFVAMNMQFEDVMVGRVLQEVYFPVIYITDNFIRFNVNSSSPVSKIRVVVHKPKDNEYHVLVNSIMSLSKALNSTKIIKKEHNVYSIQHSQ